MRSTHLCSNFKTEICKTDKTCLCNFDSNSFSDAFWHLNCNFRTSTQTVRKMYSVNTLSLGAYTQLYAAVNFGVSTGDTCVVTFSERSITTSQNLKRCSTERNHIYNYISYFTYSCELFSILRIHLFANAGWGANTWHN